MSQLAREVILGQISECTNPQDFTRDSYPPGPSTSGRRSPSREHLDIEATANLLHAAVSSHDAEGAQKETTESDIFSKAVRWGINASWVVNIVLLIAKIAAFVLSHSYAVLASAVDSLVDILSQAVLAVAEYQAARFHRRFPIGRTRMAELSVFACATIMFVSTSMVVREALGSIWGGIHGRLPHLTVDAVLFIVLGCATAFKMALYLYCRKLRKNPIMVALSEDHLNDVMSNLAAIGGAAVASYLPVCWWVDPGVALGVSLLIIRNWVGICWEQLPCPVFPSADTLPWQSAALERLLRPPTHYPGSLLPWSACCLLILVAIYPIVSLCLYIRCAFALLSWLRPIAPPAAASCYWWLLYQGQKMIGLEAPDELIQEVTQVTANHHPAMQLDRVTAYHHGSHMVVEVEVLLPASMSVRESHDIALALQHKIEAIDTVERAFVHVDYERRQLEEHKVERNLKLGVRDVMKPLPGYDASSPPSPPGAPTGASAVA